jgi:hypothetical protein
MLELPIELPKVPILLTWHSARRKELAHTWLRRTVHEVIRRFAVDEPSTTTNSAPIARASKRHHGEQGSGAAEPGSSAPSS